MKGCLSPGERAIKLVNKKQPAKISLQDHIIMGTELTYKVIRFDRTRREGGRQKMDGGSHEWKKRVILHIFGKGSAVNHSSQHRSRVGHVGERSLVLNIQWQEHRRLSLQAFAASEQSNVSTTVHVCNGIAALRRQGIGDEDRSIDNWFLMPSQPWRSYQGDWWWRQRTTRW